MSPPSLGNLDPRDRELLDLLALLAEDPIPASLLAAAAAQLGDAAPGEDGERLAGRLAEAGLASLEPAGIALTPAVRTAVLGDLSEQRRAAAVRRVGRLLAEAFPADGHDPDSWGACNALEAHARAVTALAREQGADPRDALELLNRLALYTFSRGGVVAAQEQLEPAVALADKLLAEDDPLRANLRATLGEVLIELRVYDAAEQVLRKALALHERIAGPDDPRSALDRVQLGVALEGKRDLDGARAQTERALETLERVSPRTREHVTALKFLGWTMYAQGEATDSCQRLVQALAFAIELTGPRHRETAIVRSMLGVALYAAGELATAETELRAAVVDLEAALDPDHFDLAAARSNLSDVLRQRGDTAGARVQLELALAAAERTLPPNHSAIWLRHSKLARALAALGDGEGALAHQEQALRITERSTAPNDPRRIGDLGAVAARRAALRDLPGARSAYEQALDAGAASAEADTALLVGYARELVNVLRELGDRSGALRTAVRALELSRSAQDDRLTRTSRMLTASVIHAIEADVAAAYDALELGERADAIREASSASFDALLDEGIAGDDVGAILTAGRTAVDAHRLEPATAAAQRADALLDERDAATSTAQTQLLADLWSEIGRARAREAAWEHARLAFDRQLALLRALPEPSPQSVGVALHDLANVRFGQERWEDAIALYREAVESKRKVDLPEDLAITLQALGMALVRDERLDEAAEAYQQRLDLLRALPRPSPRQIGITLHALGDVRRLQGRREEAIGLYGEAVAQKRADGPSRHLAGSLQALGRTLNQDRRSAEAEAAFVDQIAVLDQIADATPRERAFSFHDLAEAKSSQGRTAEAIEDFKRSVAYHRDAQDDRSLAITLHALGRALVQARRLDEAATTFRQRLDVLRAQAEPDPQQLGVALHDLADIARLGGDNEQAVALYEQAAEHKRRGDRRRDLATTLHALGLAREQIDRPDEAAAAYEEELAIIDELAEPDLRRRSLCIHELALLRSAHGRSEEALALVEQLVERTRAAGDRGSLAIALHALGVVLARERRLDEAEKALHERIALLHEQPDADGPTGITLHDLGDIRQLQGRHEEAVALYEQAAAYKRKSRTLSDLAITLYVLGRGLETLGRPAEAEAAYQERLELLRDAPNPDPREIGVTLYDLASVTRDQRRPEEALPLYREAIEQLRTVDAGSADRALTIALRPFGRTLARLGRAEEAEAAFQEELARRRSETSPDRHQIGVVLHDIANLRVAAGDAEEAAALYREAVEHKREGDHPSDLAVTLDALGRVLMQLERHDEATAAFEEELALLRALPEPDPESVGSALDALAETALTQGRVDVAIDLRRQLVEEMRPAAPESLVGALASLGRTLELAERFDEADAIYEEQLALMRRGRLAEPLTAGLLLLPVADFRLERGRTDEALELLRESVDHLRRTDDAAALEYALHRLGRTLRQANRVEEARIAFQEQLQLLNGGGDPDPQHVGVALHDLAALSARQGRQEEALALYEQAARHKRLGDDRADLATTLNELADAALALGRTAVAREVAAEAVAVLRTLETFDQGMLVRALLVQAQASSADLAATLELLGETRRELEHATELTDPDRALIAGEVADAYERLGFLEIAQPLRRRAAERLGSPEADPDDPFSLLAASEAQAIVGRLDAAWDLLAQATPAPGAGVPDAVTLSAASGWVALGRRLGNANELEPAAQALERSLELHPRASGATLEGTALHFLGDTRRAQGRLEEATADYGRAIEIAEDGTTDAALSLHARGRVHAALERFDAAAGDYEAVAAIARDDPTLAALALHDLSEVRYREGRLDEALDLIRGSIARQREAPAGLDLAFSLFVHARTAHAAGDPANAQATVAEAAHLLHEAWRTAAANLDLRETALLAPAPEPLPAAAAQGAAEPRRERSPQASAECDAHVLLARLALGDDCAPEALVRDLELRADADAAASPAIVAALGVVALGAGSSRARRAAARKVVRAALGAAADDAGAGALLALAGAALDVGESRRACALLERAQAADEGRELEAQIGLAWHWTSAHLEHAGELEGALDAYRRSSELLAVRGPLVQATALAGVADLLRRLGEAERAHEQTLAIGWRCLVEVRDARIALLMRIARLRLLLDEPLAARAAFAKAAVNMRLGQPATGTPGDAPTPEAVDAAREIVAALSPLAAALLERLRQDEHAAAERHTAPGTTIPAGAAHSTLAAADELTSAGLVRHEALCGWFGLTPLGRAAASLLGGA